MTTTTPPAPVARGFRRPRIIARLAAYDATTLIAGAILLALALSAVFAPWLAPYDPSEPDVLATLAGPSLAHPLGTDDTGRDILSRLLYGGRSTLGGAVLVVLITSIAGTAVALSAAWFGGWFDSVVSRVTDIVFAFPGLLLAILVVSVFGTGFWAPVIALSIAFTPSVVRILRSVAQREVSLPYIDALRVHGFGTWAILTQHVLPNVFPILLVQITVGFGYAMIDLAAISFLGLGLQPPATEWGLTIAQGRTALLNGHPEQAVFGSIVLLLAVVSCTLLGERLAQRTERSIR